MGTTSFASGLDGKNITWLGGKNIRSFETRAKRGQGIT